MTDEAEKAYEAQIIEPMARAMDPDLFSADGWEAHCAASPVTVEIARERVRVKARAAADAIGLKPGMVIVPREASDHMLSKACDSNSARRELASELYGYMIETHLRAAALPRQPEKEGA